MLIPLLRKAATAALALLLLWPALAGAADHGETTPLNLPVSSDNATLDKGHHSSTGGLVRTIVGLAIVIAVIYGVTWVLRQVKQSREERTRGNGLSSVAVMGLGAGRSLHLVRAGRELVLLGVADHGVVPIRTYSEEEAEALGLDADDLDDDPPSSSGAGPRLPFSQILESLRERTSR